MKNVVCSLTLLVLGISSATAQTEKGRWTVGAQVGNISYSPGEKPYRITNFSVSVLPSAGYFVADNLVVGLSVPVNYQHYQTRFATVGNTQYSITNTQLGLAPFVRYYVGSARLRPFIDATVGYTQQWYRARNLNGVSENLYKQGSFAYGGSIGAAYFINNTVSLDASLGYRKNNVVNTSLVSTGYREPGTIGLNVGFRIFLGR
ncbi:outer membrane beta-barrel protein [Spirosoma sordidisoli]|uniref:Outer membrane protein beta-barrel domain-containing protein n=1 Tax=Spirosoma sordidisoli TaxID=2502893 RepID=A0A4Q2UF07_9BACT|nr:outer membrane beta-barrel protein [Spirosoma sordidisoli]RYC66912.1 hypothetical protein EQG79_27820 [Spirosoma sordidisoli]